VSEGLKIALTAVVGISVFIVGQIVMKWFIEPIQEQRRLIGEIAYALKFYKNYDKDIIKPEQIREGRAKFRNLACDLDRSLCLIPLYPILDFFGIVRKRKQILDAGPQLIYISNSLGDGDFTKARNKIISCLKIRNLIPDD
jgi:hypothetical protein